jgi:hypothetical protein
VFPFGGGREVREGDSGRDLAEDHAHRESHAHLARLDADAGERGHQTRALDQFDGGGVTA